MKFLSIFKRKESTIDKLLIDFLSGNGIKEFVNLQGEAQQEHYWRLKEVERIRNIKEKYGYLQNKKDRGLDVNQEEYDYVKYVSENNTENN